MGAGKMSNPWEDYGGKSDQGNPWEDYDRRKTKVKSAPPLEPIDPAEGMAWHEKALVGAGGGLRKLYLGAKDLVGQGTEEEAQELKDWAKNKEHLGGWGTAGEIGAEMLATAPLGGPVASAGKVLTRAVP